MPVISFASGKGGCGKTTSATATVFDLALDGHTVALLDCDPNGHAATIAERFRRKHADAGRRLDLRAAVSEADIYEQIRSARAAADFVILDLPGVASKLTLKGLTKSHLVLIPVQPSSMDAVDAARTVALIREAEETTEKALEARFLLTRWPVLRETRVAAHTRRALDATGIATLPTPFMDRTQWKELTYSGVPPRVSDPHGNAAGNLQALVQDILAALDVAAAKAAATA